MYKTLVEYTIRLIAYFSNLYPSLVFENVKDFVRSFIINDLNDMEIHAGMRLLEENYRKYKSGSSTAKNVSNLSNLDQMIRDTGRDVPYKQKLLLTIKLLMFEKTLLQLASGPVKSNVNYFEIMDLITNSLEIDKKEYDNCKHFISENLYKIKEKEKLLIVGNTKLFDLEMRFIPYNNLKGHMFFLQIDKLPDTFLFYFKGNDLLTMNRKAIFPRQVYLFLKGYAINVPGNNDVTFRHVQMEFLEPMKKHQFEKVSF